MKKNAYWAAAALLVTCVAWAIPAATVHAQMPPPPGAYMQAGPPPEVVEEVPVRPPGPGWIWQKGHWRWKNGQYVWRPGHWAQRPPQAMRWVPPHWSQGPQGWYFVEGHWQ